MHFNTNLIYVKADKDEDKDKEGEESALQSSDKGTCVACGKRALALKWLNPHTHKKGYSY